MELQETLVAVPAKDDIKNAAIHPSAMPITPPVNVSMTDSARNCVRDVLSLRADRLPQTDLASAFGYRREHHVHDADAANEERDRGDRGKKRRERTRHADAAETMSGLVQDSEIGLRGIRNIVPLQQEGS